MQSNKYFFNYIKKFSPTFPPIITPINGAVETIIPKKNIDILSLNRTTILKYYVPQKTKTAVVKN